MNNSSEIYADRFDHGQCNFLNIDHQLDAFLFIVISMAAIIGNSFVFVVYIRHRMLRNTTNIFILSLSASDILVASLSIPYSFGVFLCNIRPAKTNSAKRELEDLIYVTCDMLPSILSIYSLSLVAIDRAMAVQKPFFHKKYVNQKRATITVGVMWVSVASIVAFVFFMGMKQFTLLAIFISYVIPVTIMIISYSFVAYVAKKHAVKINKLERTASRFREASQSNLNETEEEKKLDDTSEDSLLVTLGTSDSVQWIKSNVIPKSFRWLPTPIYPRRTNVNTAAKFLWRELKASFKLSFILTCFVLSWTPFMALNIEFFRCPKCSIDIKMVKYFKLLHYSNSALNPVLYILLNRTWKKAFHMTLRCRPWKQRLVMKSIGW